MPTLLVSIRNINFKRERRTMPKKDGELRLLKSGAVYGPMGRDDFERLRSAGKVTADELVSLRGGPWMTVADFVVSSAIAPVPEGPAAPASDVVAGAAALDDNDPVLRLLTGKRIVTALSRADVNRLRQSGRMDDDDLICALYGPWMRVGDFFSPPRRRLPATLLEEEGIERDPSLQGAALPVQPAARLLAPAGIPGPPAPIATGLDEPPASSVLSDDWFVRVRGIHSAPLRKHHVKALFEANEITRDNVARHVTWPESLWLPIHDIPQLADAVV